MSDEPDPTEPDAREYLDDPVLCVHCTKVIPWDANLCVHCKAPQNFIASTDPYQRVHAEGFILRTAAEHPRSWLTVIGIWVLVGSWSVPLLIWFAVMWQTAGLHGRFSPELLGPLLVALAGTTLAVRTTMNFRRWRRRMAPGNPDIPS